MSTAAREEVKGGRVGGESDSLFRLVVVVVVSPEEEWEVLLEEGVGGGGSPRSL